MAREFTIVPADNVLYSLLGAIHANVSAGDVKSADVSTKSATMTRYEMALEVTKTLLAWRAYQSTDAGWISTLSAKSLRSMRALCIELQPELARFNVDSKATIALLNSWQTETSTPSISTDLESRTAHQMQRMAESEETDKSVALQLPISQRLRVYGALSSLKLSSQDPLQPNEFTRTSGSLRWNTSTPQTFGHLGGEFSLDSRIQFHGEVSQQPVARTLREVLEGHTSTAEVGHSQSFGGGVKVALWPGVTISGGAAHYESSGGLLLGATPFSGMKYEGELGLSGWQNRVALSANLSRLVPEDSLALSTSAAQLNLDVGLTQQISLKLLYQQLFEAPQQSRGDRMIAGGINIKF
jgi:hypothetical protein